jgi:glycosyltransferase involved in cell wall biosynthesis
MSKTVTAEISTKDRYFTTLPMAIMSIAQQSVKPNELIIFDDGQQLDLRDKEPYNSIFPILSKLCIDWKVLFGARRGQVTNHQAAIEMSKNDFIWRMDDDDWAEPNVLERLLAQMKPDVGAVGPLVHDPKISPLPVQMCSGKIEDWQARANLQWSELKIVTEVDHLNNTFLFRREAAKHGYPRELSPVGHGEETLFTYGFRRAKLKVIVEPAAVVWHMRAGTGGIRSYNDEQLWKHDEDYTRRKLADWGVTLTGRESEDKLIVLDNGLGDHIAFASILPEIKRKYPNRRVVVAACYPEVFKNDNVSLISIAQAKQMLNGKLEAYDIYKFMWDHQWKTQIVDAFRAMYL